MPATALAQSVSATIPTDLDLGVFLQKIANLFLQILMVAAVFYIIYAGLLIMNAQGDPVKLAKGKMTLVWALVGLLVAMSAFVIVNLIKSAAGVLT